MKFIKDNWFSLVMYAMFGMVLAAAGVGITEQPVQFLILLGILTAVDVNSYGKGLRR